MADILSQAEIDALLSAMSSGELDTNQMEQKDAKKIKIYDFNSPTKFSKEHLRTLEIIFENYGRLLDTNLPAYLRKNVQVAVVNSEAIAYSEFSNALSNPVIFGIIDFEPLQGNIVMELASNIGYAMIDRLLGGVGESIEKKREFSEIEISILERILTICIDYIRQPWGNVIAVRPKLNRIETNSQFAQIIAPNEMIAIVTLNVTVGDEEGLMNIILPYITLEEVMDKLNTKYWYSTMQQKDEESYEEAIESIISKTKVPIRAVLGNSSISVNDFANIQRGDIIKLDTKIDQELNIFVGNILKFKALPGTATDKYAVRVTSVVREE